MSGLWNSGLPGFVLVVTVNCAVYLVWLVVAWFREEHDTPAGRPDYRRIRQLEQDIYGEWFTVDQLPSKDDEERLRPFKLARAYEVEAESNHAG